MKPKNIRDTANADPRLTHVDHHGLQIFPAAHAHHLGWFNALGQHDRTPRRAQIVKPHNREPEPHQEHAERSSLATFIPLIDAR